MGIRIDEEQNFTCRSCAECCTRDFDIFVSAGERERYEAAGARRWFRSLAGAAEGETETPFVPARGGYAVRKRPDGTCGFLSPERRCRIHEELGAEGKPLTCQLFPFSFEFRGDDVLVQQSFTCPTIVENVGAPAEAHQKAVGAIARRWRKDAGARDVPLEWVRGVPLTEASLEAMRWALRRMLDAHGASYSLRGNVRRIGALIDDWTRRRVLKLDPDARAEYMKLTGEFAASAAPRDPAPGRAPSRLTRALFRGFFFASVAPSIQRSDAGRSGLVRRARLFRRLAQIHGLGGGGGLDLPRAFGRSIPIDDEPFFTPAYHVLRAAIENIGATRRPVAESLNLAAAQLAVAETLFLSRSETESGASPAWIRAIMDAHDVAQADPASPLGRILAGLCPVPAGFLILGGRAAA